MHFLLFLFSFLCLYLWFLLLLFLTSSNTHTFIPFRTTGLTRIRTDKKLMASSLERQRQKLQNNTGSKKSFTQHEKVNLSSSENPAAVSFNNSSVIHRSPSSLALANTNVNGKININRSVVRENPDMSSILFPRLLLRNPLINL